MSVIILIIRCVFSVVFFIINWTVFFLIIFLFSQKIVKFFDTRADCALLRVILFTLLTFSEVLHNSDTCWYLPILKKTKTCLNYYYYYFALNNLSCFFVLCWIKLLSPSGRKVFIWSASFCIFKVNSLAFKYIILYLKHTLLQLHFRLRGIFIRWRLL